MLRRYVDAASRVAAALTDPARRADLRRQAARVLGERLGDAAGEVAALRLVLEDEEDRDALERVADDAERSGRYEEACSLLARLEASVAEPADKIRLLLRIARLRSSETEDVDGALSILDRVLRDLDASCSDAIELSVDLLTSRGDWKGVADVLDRARQGAANKERRLALILRLAAVWEERLEDPRRTAEYLQEARKLAPDDTSILRRLAALLETCGLWEQLSEVLAAMAPHARDLDELSSLAIRRAALLEHKLGRAHDALSVVVELADLGDRPCRLAYVRIADDASRKDLAAIKLEKWSAGEDGTDRDIDGLVAAFDRYLQSRLLHESARVAGLLRDQKEVGRQVSHRLEEVALQAGELGFARIAQGYLLESREGREAAEEAVRQAEVLVAAGADRNQAVIAAEALFAGIEPREAHVFLPRLSSLAPTPDDRLAIYERQVARSTQKDERLIALAEAAMVAARLGLAARCRRLFAMGISSSTTDDDLVALERTACVADEEMTGTSLRRAWAEALAEGAAQARGGANRQAALLRKAALIAHRDLQDPGLGFDWANEALLIKLTAAVQAAFRQQSDQVRKLTEAVEALARRVDSGMTARLASDTSPQISIPGDEELGKPRAPFQSELGIPVMVDLTSDDDLDEGMVPARPRVSSVPFIGEDVGDGETTITIDTRVPRGIPPEASSPTVTVEELPVTLEVMEELMSVGEHAEPDLELAKRPNAGPPKEP